MSGQTKTKAKTVRASGGVSIIRRGAKFYIRFRDHEGVRRTHLAGTTLDEAKAAAAAEAADIARKRVDVLAGKAVGVTPMRFEPFVKEFLPTKTLRPATLTVIATQVGAFDRFLKERGDPSLDKITKSMADAFLAQEKARGCADAYLSRIAWVLGYIWRGAIERGLATENHFARREYSRKTRLEVPYLTPAQLDAVLAAVKPLHRDFVTVLADTGMRCGELIGLAWRDLDLDAAHPQVTVERQGPERAFLKTDSARRSIPLSPRALDILKRRRDAAEPGVERVFPDNDTGYNILLSLHAACAAVNAPRLRLHDLRHLFASHLVQTGEPMRTVARLLGHADGGVLVAKRYGRWAPPDAETRAMERLTKFRTSQVPAPSPQSA